MDRVQFVSYNEIFYLSGWEDVWSSGDFRLHFSLGHTSNIVGRTGWILRGNLQFSVEYTMFISTMDIRWYRSSVLDTEERQLKTEETVKEV